MGKDVRQSDPELKVLKRRSQPTTGSETPNPTSSVRLALLGFFVCLVLFAGFETLSRAAYTIRGDLSASRALKAATAWTVRSPDLGWERKPGFRGQVAFERREFDDQGYVAADSEQVTDQGARKVIFVGDSNTFGYMVSTEDSFVEVVDRLYPEGAAINLGVNGYSSYQGLKTLEKYLPRLNPAAIVVSFNFNDRRAAGGGEPDSQAAFERAFHASQSALGAVNGPLQLFSSYRAVRGAMRRAGILPQGSQRVDEMTPRVDEAGYRQNLSRMADLARERGVPIIFMLLHDNPLQVGYIRRGIERSNIGDYSGAIQYLNAALRANGAFSDLARLYLAKAYDAWGHEEEAAEVALSSSLSAAIFGGAQPIRLDSAYNRIMTEVAAEYGADLVDAGTILDQMPYVYIDDCHFNAVGHREVGRLLAARLRKVLDE